MTASATFTLSNIILTNGNAAGGPAQYDPLGGAILNQGEYLVQCGVPLWMGVKICAAIRGGRAVAVSVTATPGDARVARCIGNALQSIAFPNSPGLDVATTVFAAQ